MKKSSERLCVIIIILILNRLFFKGDSGGPMWKIENVGGNGPKAFLIGITNRGTGCARYNVI